METILVGKAVLNNNLCYFVSQTTKSVVISETKAQLIIKQILRGFVTYNVYHNRKEDRLSIILHGWLRSQQLHTDIQVLK